MLYDGSKSGIKRLELFDSEIKFKKQNPAKIIALIDCVRVVTCQLKKTNYTFEVSRLLSRLESELFGSLAVPKSVEEAVAAGRANQFGSRPFKRIGRLVKQTPTQLAEAQANRPLGNRWKSGNSIFSNASWRQFASAPVGRPS